MFHSLLRHACAIMLLGSHAVVLALPADSKQPIEIEAQKLIMDQQKGISTYSGHVTLTQGSIRIEAEQLLVHTRNGKFDRLEAFGSDTQQASFRQQLANGEETRGNAGHIQYSAGKSRLTLQQRAQLQQSGNRIQSDRIDYNTASNSLLAGQQDPAQSRQRVRIVIEPADDMPKQSTEQKQP
ncbi:MAG TPA: lipopolysaccharide transport periplasmic protein LptA [Gammaproteobacteria bacterium]|nr:lipopolysaccharide transport periplasmic protein LptA [Gammaproteobacteria bacterium]